jgi:hypothetical protein
MKAGARRRTLANVDETGTATARMLRPALAGIVRCLLFCSLAILGQALPARADEEILENTAAPIVRIVIGEGDVTVRTWDREAISVDGDPSLTIERHPTQQSGRAVPIAIPAIALPGDDGALALPPESFVTEPMEAGPRELVVIKSSAATPRAPVTVVVPNDTPFLFARAGSGRLDVDDYRAGTLIAIARTGRLTLTNVGGTVFAQTLRGPIVARASNFDRIRARSLAGNVTFERCNVRQIEATTVAGSIVYDGGSFAPGLARFESIRGNVAIGASGGVQYGARTAGDGRVYTNFNGRAAVDARDGQTNATVGDGGPVVTATTQGGSVFLYDGSLRARAQQLPASWQPAVDTLQRPAVRRHFEGSPAQRFAPPAFRRYTHFGIPNANEPPPRR